MSSFLSLRASLVDWIREKMPALKSVSVHPGRFDQKALGEFITAAPAVKLVMLGVTSVADVNNGQLDARINYAAYLVSKDVAEVDRLKDRNDLAIQLCEQLVLTLAFASPQTNSFFIEPKSLKVENITGGFGLNNVVIWAVLFQMTARIGVDLFDEPVTTVTDVFGHLGDETIQVYGAEA